MTGHGMLWYPHLPTRRLNVPDVRKNRRHVGKPWSIVARFDGVEHPEEPRRKRDDSYLRLDHDHIRELALPTPSVTRRTRLR